MSSDIKDNKSLKSNEFDAIGNDHDGIAKSQRLSQEQDDVKRTIKGLQEDDLNDEFFSKVIGTRGTLVDWKPMEIECGENNFTKGKKQTMHSTKKIGLFGYMIRYTSHSGSVVEWPVVMKSKPLDSDIPVLLKNNQKPGQRGGAEIAELQAILTVSNVKLSHTREVAIVQMEELQQFLPQSYHSISSISEEMFAFVMEYLSNEHFTHLNTADDISGWTTADIKVVLRDMAKIHALFMDKVEWLNQQSWMDHTHSRDVAITFCPLWKGSLAKVASKFPEFWTSKVVEMTTKAIDSMDELWKIFDSFPKTLIQNDCNPRNICIRKVATDQSANSDEDPRQMCIYDWEVARIDVPQHDLAEFLAFVLPPECPIQRRMEMIEYYIEMLQKYSKRKFDHGNFLKVLDAAALDFQLNRLNMYTLAMVENESLHFKFLSRVVGSNAAYLFQRKSDGHIKFISKL